MSMVLAPISANTGKAEHECLGLLSNHDERDIDPYTTVKPHIRGSSAFDAPAMAASSRIKTTVAIYLRRL